MLSLEKDKYDKTSVAKSAGFRRNWATLTLFPSVIFLVRRSK